MNDQASNPYCSLTAIRNPDMFFGRQILLRRIYEILINRQSVSLIGPRGIGKSSLLYCACLPEMKARFPFDLSRHVFVLLDLREHIYESSEEFFHGVCREIIKKCQSFSNLTLQSNGRGADEFSDILEQINLQGFFPVLILDAFDKITLNEQFGPEFFSFLRAHATFGKIAYVTGTIASLYDLSHRGISGSPFFNIFFSAPLGALTEAEALELISLPAEREGMPFSDKEKAWVRKEAGLHPFMLQRVCYVLFNEKRQSLNKEVNLLDVRKKAHLDLLPYMAEIWEKLPKDQRASLLDEAQQKGNQLRVLPELSESAFFRQFVRDISKVGLLKMSVEELEEALNVMNDPTALGGTNLRLMKAVTGRLDDDIQPTAAEKGKVIRDVLNEAFEKLHGAGSRSDTAPDWLNYNILFYRYFRNHLKNNVIAGRLGFTSDRQYYRARNKAIEALRNILLEME
jgi:AAA+ ATPase superfamily predicted ATPase